MGNSLIGAKHNILKSCLIWQNQPKTGYSLQLVVGIAYVAVVFHGYNFHEIFAAASGGAGSKHANIVWYHLVVLITEAVIIVALVAMRKYNGILKQRYNTDFRIVPKNLKN